MKKTCRTCKDRDGCTALCADIEANVNQDYALPPDCQLCDRRGECSVDYMEGFLCERRFDIDIDMIKPENVEKIITKSNEEIIVHLFFIERIRVGKIAENINVSQPYVSKIVKKYKSILKKNLQK